MDSGRLADLVDRIVADRGIDSVMVVRNGYVVLDAVIYPFAADFGHNMYSVTKSVTGTLVGIAIDRGFLAGVDVPVVDILAERAPESIDGRKAAMTVGDLLSMSTGLECRDSYLHGWRGLREMRASDDWPAHVLSLPMADEPGNQFEYCNGSSHLLSALVGEVTEMPAADFAADVLFAPLGIEDFFWPADPSGINTGGGGLVLKPPDIAKLGLLYLRNGAWKDTQVVSAEWVNAATAAQIRAGTLSDNYGYQWWVDDAGYVMAIGFGGQHVILVPDYDLLVTFTAGLPRSRTGDPELLTAEYVLPAILSNEPLPSNPVAVSRLAAAVAAAGAAPQAAPVDLPELAATINGVRYEFRDNNFGHMWFSLSFVETAGRLRLMDRGPIGAEDTSEEFLALSGIENVDEAMDVEIGLDGRFAIGEAYGQPVAMRGTWSNEDTFFIEYRFLRHADRGTMQFRFSGNAARFTLNEVTRGISQTTTAERQ